jgi:hypothetical protein
MNWTDANQLGRRNLKPDQLSYIRGRLYNRQKQKHGGQLPKGKSQIDTSLDTASAIANTHGVSRATVIRDGKKAEAIDKRPSRSALGRSWAICQRPNGTNTKRATALLAFCRRGFGLADLIEGELDARNVRPDESGEIIFDMLRREHQVGYFSLACDCPLIQFGEKRHEIPATTVHRVFLASPIRRVIQLSSFHPA